MEQLAELERHACPTIDLVNEVLDADDEALNGEKQEEDDEESDAEMIAEECSAAQARAPASGLTFGKSEMAAAVKQGKAKAKDAKQAAGKFKLIRRGKNANKTDPKNGEKHGDGLQVES